MLLVSCRQIEKSYDNKKILDNISLDIAPLDRIALIGKNGAGKTTLLRILAGYEKPDSGQILTHRNNLTTGYLNQGREEISQEIDFSSEFLATTKNLGLNKVQNWDEDRWPKISGGEKTKLALARIRAQNPNLLLLDEPTNHLDYQGIKWLIEELNNFPGALLVVSHDRYFLDQITQKTLELKGKITTYPGNYSFYRKERKRRRESQLRQHKQEKKEEQKLKEEIKKVKDWAQKGQENAGEKARKHGVQKGGKEHYRARAQKKDQQAKSKTKRLEKLKEEKTEKPPKDPELNVDLKNSSKRGRRLLEATNITKSYPEKVLFRESSFYLLRGEKIGFWGPNGAGKSTLISLIL